MRIKRLADGALFGNRWKYLSSDDARLSSHLGFFVKMFGLAEMSVTAALFVVLDMKDVIRAEYLTKGMDAGVKCQRLRQAAKAYKPLGPHLKEQLEIFEIDCIPTRNRLAHSWPYLETHSNIIYFASFSNLPDTDIKAPPKNLRKLDGIHIDDLFTLGVWMDEFEGDIRSAIRATQPGKLLEIADERKSPLRQLPLGSQSKESPTNSDKRSLTPPPNEED